MKIIARAVTALALLAFATPALPCSDKQSKTTTASAADEKRSTTVAKSSDKGAKSAQGKATQESKPASAAN